MANVFILKLLLIQNDYLYLIDYLNQYLASVWKIWVHMFLQQLSSRCQGYINVAVSQTMLSCGVSFFTSVL